MKESTFSPGWDEENVRRVLAHYKPQTPETPVGPNINRLTAAAVFVGGGGPWKTLTRSWNGRKIALLLEGVALGIGRPI